MQPKNPHNAAQPGSQASEQLQEWIAGPDSANENAVVVLAKMVLIRVRMRSEPVCKGRSWWKSRWGCWRFRPTRRMDTIVGM
jgi:hypothetical protein